MDTSITRRNFLRDTLIGGGSILLLGSTGILHLSALENDNETRYSMILINYQLCTGCRTCEAVCSSWHNSIEKNGKTIPVTASPALARIQVHSYNPDADIPSLCAMCDDAPCVDACPVSPHEETGRRALYRDPETLVIRNDVERCIACGSCAQACEELRRGVIRQDDSGKPVGMCDLCDGDPQCVKNCPYGALAYISHRKKGRKYAMSPDRIAEILTREWYGTNGGNHE
ncbi:MAG: 4Fe-4S dicluster domain-containing protein [Spirochaetota bacterium]